MTSEDLGSWARYEQTIRRYRQPADLQEPQPAPTSQPIEWAECSRCGHRCKPNPDHLCGKCRSHQLKQHMNTNAWSECELCEHRCRKRPDHLCGKCRARIWRGGPNGRLYHETYKHQHRPRKEEQ